MRLEAMVKGLTGELKTKFVNKLLLDENYHIFNNVIIQTGIGPIQIDHVIVSKFGLFVIETKEKTGWIFGDHKREKRTQSTYGKIYQFQNPLRQNYCHIKSLSEFLHIEHYKIHSLVIFWGDCEFKTSMPDNVLKGSIFDNNIKHYIQSKSRILLTTDEVDHICSLLKKAKDSAGLLSGWHHTRDLNNRYRSTITCPKCGSKLVERVSNKGKKAGEAFLGCSNFPRCHYIEDL